MQVSVGSGVDPGDVVLEVVCDVVGVPEVVDVAVVVPVEVGLVLPVKVWLEVYVVVAEEVGVLVSRQSANSAP